MRYVLGAGISGLLYAFYHPEYSVFTDDVSQAVMGKDPQILLRPTDLAWKLLHALGFKLREVSSVTRPIGYLTDRGFVDAEDLTRGDVDTILKKKMVPWKLLRMAESIGAEIDVQTPSRKLSERTTHISYLDVNVRELLTRLLSSVESRNQLRYESRVESIDRETFTVRQGKFPYEHVVSTIPAPVFAKLWAGRWGQTFNSMPVTFAVRRARLATNACTVYDAREGSPFSRISRADKDRLRYEVTGVVDEKDLPEDDWEDLYVWPYGRIVQDVGIESPSSKITFLGRFAEWRYESLVHEVLEKIHVGVLSA